MVTRVMNDIIVLTIEGVPEKYTKFEISKRFDYFIQIDHDFERFVVEKRNICKKTDVWLKLQEEMKRNDLKTDKNWIEIDKNTSNKRRFCTFTAKRRCYDWIKDGEIVLLSQCWIVHGIVRRKTNFLYAKKCDKTASYKQNDPKIVCFEILIDENDNNNNNNNWIPNIPQAYYFITIDSSFLFENGCGWQKFIIVDTENRRIFQRESAETIDFDVVHWNIELLTDQKNNDIIHNELSEEIRTCKSIEGSSRSISIPDRVNTEISDISIIYGRIESLKIHDFNVHLKEIGFVNIFHISAEGNQLRIFIDISDECNSDEMSTFFEIGRYIFLSLDHTSDNLNIIGKVHEQRSATVFMISIDSELSNSLFWSVWIRYMYSFNIRSMKMLCHIHE
ncbi:unnamed protein product [Caenorhabditis angaria]|uniref:Uncharacterized protein n=1 Tax=Caenorhabditis angaria TaxID=860376 RepID=A0A9P1IGJ1_9PELO|nr:unnamed protein product [Caenorhabditis angaria]